MPKKSKGTGAGAPQQAADKLLADYALSLEAANRSPATLSWYSEILEAYFSFLRANKLLRPIHVLGARELRAYVLNLQSRERRSNRLRHGTEDEGRLSPASVQGHVRAIKAFWGWLHREGYVDKDPLAKYPLPAAPQKVLNIFTPVQAEKLLKAVDRSTPLGMRNYLIILLLYDTGLRISELVHIRMQDLEVQGDFIRVLGKGQKQRLVPVSGLSRREIVRFESRFRPQLCAGDSPFLFALADGQSITANGVEQLLRRLAGKAEIHGIRCSPHTFRHSFATQFLTNGGNVFVLKEIMGHSSLQTTLKYTHLQPRDLRDQHARYSPVVNLGIGRSGGGAAR